MLEDLYYRRETVVDVDAAVVGVSRLRWQSLAPAETTDLAKAKSLMAEHQFDVLPVDQPGQDVRAYVRTTRWGDYSEVEQHDIKYEDVIPQQTPLYAVIRGFATDNRHHYFLAHEGNITGLITIVNLNCRQARLLVFSLLSDLEVRLGRLVQSRIGNGLTVNTILSEAKDEVRQRYEADRRESVDRQVVEYLYLTDLLKLVRKYEMYKLLGYTSKGEFSKASGKLPDLRNAVAHPARAMIEDAEGTERLWHNIQVIQRALFRLQQWERDTEASERNQ